MTFHVNLFFGKLDEICVFFMGSYITYTGGNTTENRFKILKFHSKIFIIVYYLNKKYRSLKREHLQTARLKIWRAVVPLPLITCECGCDMWRGKFSTLVLHFFVSQWKINELTVGRVTRSPVWYKQKEIWQHCCLCCLTWLKSVALKLLRNILNTRYHLRRQQSDALGIYWVFTLTAVSH